MPVFRHVDRLPRRYCRSLRKYSAGRRQSGEEILYDGGRAAVTESYRTELLFQGRCLRTIQANKQLLRKPYCDLFILQCQSFTTDAKGTGDDPTRMDTLLPPLPPPPDLHAIATDARGLVDKLKDRKDSELFTDGIYAVAQEMLSLTYPPYPLADELLKSNHEQLSESAANLHRSLVQVTSTCIRFIDKDPLLLEAVMDLTHRAHDLSLPFHLFLYRDVVTAIAKHSRDGAPAAAILEVSVWTTSALQTPLDSRFFCEALLALIESHQLQEAIDLQLGMRNRHDIEEMDLDTTLKMLTSLKKVLQRIDNDTTSGKANSDAADAAAELITMLTRMVKNDVKDWIDVISTGSLNSTLSSALDSTSDDDDDDELDDDFDYDSDESEDDNDDTEDIAGLLDSLSSFAEEVASKKSSRGSLSDKPRRSKLQSDGSMVVTVQLDQDTGDVQNVTSMLPQQASNDDQGDDHVVDQRETTRKFIYKRDPANWDIPDVTSQYVSLCQAEKAAYSEDYEDKIWKELVEEGADDHHYG